MINLTTAKTILHIDGNSTDTVINSILTAAPSYIETVTGLETAKQYAEPLCDTITSFILPLWYFADKSETYKLQNVINSLCTLVKAKVVAGAYINVEAYQGNE